MKTKVFLSVLVFSLTVLFSYGSANAQVTQPVKDVAVKTKDVAAETSKKPEVVVTDNLQIMADKAKEAAPGAMKPAASTTKTFGSNTVSVTENISGQTYEGGKWFMVTKWDGTKWVSKRTWFPDKKSQSPQ